MYSDIIHFTQSIYALWVLNSFVCLLLYSCPSWSGYNHKKLFSTLNGLNNQNYNDFHLNILCVIISFKCIILLGDTGPSHTALYLNAAPQGRDEFLEQGWAYLNQFLELMDEVSN